MAVDRFLLVLAAAAAGSRTETCIHSEAIGESFRFEPEQESGGTHGWQRYAGGVFELAGRPVRPIPAFDALVISTIPLGARLSSSAALTVGLLTLVESLAGFEFALRDKALLCQEVEREFAGVPCGTMDPFVIAGASKGCALEIDSRSVSAHRVELPADKVGVLVADSRLRRELASSIYAQRRQECEQAAKVLGVGSLREVTPDDLAAGGSKLIKVLKRRVRHVVTESARVGEMALALSEQRWSDAGVLMSQSHRSLREDFEVSVGPIDEMVEALEAIGPEGGVHRSRMTGGGMGGCVVSLIDPSCRLSLTSLLTERFGAIADIEPSVFLVEPVDGARAFALGS